MAKKRTKQKKKNPFKIWQSYLALAISLFIPIPFIFGFVQTYRFLLTGNLTAFLLASPMLVGAFLIGSWFDNRRKNKKSLIIGVILVILSWIIPSIFFRGF